jgi:hypothetical protein
MATFVQRMSNADNCLIYNVQRAITNAIVRIIMFRIDATVRRQNTMIRL